MPHTEIGFMARTNTRTTVGRWFRGGAACLLLATASSWALEDQASQVGLRGLIPSKAPAGLTDREFELLDGKWQEWSTQTVELVDKLYSDEALDVAAQRDLLSQLKSRAEVMNTALNDSAYRQLHGPLSDLQGRLVRRVEFATAVLDILEADPQAAEQRKLQSAYGDLSSAITGVNSDLSSFQGGDLWKPYLELEALSSSAGSLDKSPSTVEANQQGHSSTNPDAGMDRSAKAVCGSTGHRSSERCDSRRLECYYGSPSRREGQVRELAGHLLGGTRRVRN